MGISIEQWREKVGTFVPQTKWKSKMQVWITGKDVLSLTLGLSLVLSLLLVVSGSVEENPGPGQGSESGQIEIVYDRVRDICGTVQDNQSAQCLKGTKIAQITADSPDLNSQISFYLSRILCIDNASSSRQKITRSLTHADEYIQRKIRSPDEPYEVLTGSFVEGSVLEGSDGDVMCVLPHISATENSSQDNPNQSPDGPKPSQDDPHSSQNGPKQSQNDPNEECCELVMDMEGTRPGFSKLHLHNPSILETEKLPSEIEYSLIHTDDKSACISSQKFREYYLKLNQIFNNKNSDMSVTAHGPCSTFLVKTISGTKCADTADAIECNAWPEEAMEWVSRPRPEGWPSREEVSRLKEMPCFLLPVGDPVSKDWDLEWRFAFVPTERELIWSFNDTQIQCMILLKKLKIQYLESLAPDQLSSFYFKTIIFWESEKHGLDMWCHENLIGCVHQCLETLKNSVKSLELPHYIYRKRNLLYSKFTDQQQKTAVLQKISEIQDNIIPYVLGLGCTEEECDDIVESAKNGTLLKEPVFSNEFADLQKGKEWERRHFILSFLLNRLTPLTVNEKFYQLVDEFKQNIISLEKSDQKAIVCFLSIKIGKSILSDMCETEDSERKDVLMYHASHYFEEGQWLDSASGSLYLATFSYTCKKYDEALNIITDVCSKSNTVTSFYIGNCVKHGPLLSTPGKTSEDVLKSENKVVAFDVIFRSGDLSFVPHAVKSEFALDHLKRKHTTAVFHPLVYAHYLYFQICLDKEDKEGCHEAIQKLLFFLNSVLTDDKDLHEDLQWTFNLLGFCFYKSGWYGAAIHLFRKSLHVYYNKWNAALLHMWCMFLDMEKTSTE